MRRLLLKPALAASFITDCNTRYDWLVKPCSAGTFTLQETPSFAWRTSGERYPPRVGFEDCIASKMIFGERLFFNSH